MSELPSVMNAVVIEQPGGPEELVVRQRPVPAPGPGELLLRVRAAGVNRADAVQREGRYPAPPGVPEDIPGLEVAGEVAAVGEGGDPALAGSRRTALVGGGGYAEFCVVPAGSSLPWPDGYDAVQAASLPEAILTVWSNVFDRGGLKEGESLLVHGGASGIGTAAIQLAKAFGARVYATAGSDERCRRCVEIGADAAINYREEDFVEAVKRETGGRGVDVILDIVGGAYVSRNYRAAAVDGRIVQIAFQQGASAEVNLAPLMLKRLVHTGSTLRSREEAFKTRLAEDVRKNVWPLLDSGRFVPQIDSVFRLDHAPDAHRRLEGEHFGKIVLRVGEG
ncbi:MAG TPA: NAD(P)H-quinone oxidoreductase [Fimbriimonas sp.]